MGFAVAIVDENATYREDHLVRELGQFGFDVEGFAGEAGLHRRLLARSFDVLVLGLENESGLEIARYLRTVSPIKIVVLANDEMLSARMQGVPDAMDICLSKSINIDALAANLQCLARSIRTHRAATSIGWRLSKDESQLISPNGRGISLNAIERRLLTRVLAAPGEVVLHADLIADLAIESTTLNQRGLKALVCRLRQRVLSGVGIALPLRSVPGYGYRTQIGRTQEREIQDRAEA
jgi:DNA-binding response OmpR family regulator